MPCCLELPKTLSRSGGEQWFTVLKVSPLESLSSVPFVFTTGCGLDVFLWAEHMGFLFYFLNRASGLISVLNVLEPVFSRLLCVKTLCTSLCSATLARTEKFPVMLVQSEE